MLIAALLVFLGCLGRPLEGVSIKKAPEHLSGLQTPKTSRMLLKKNTVLSIRQANHSFSSVDLLWGCEGLEKSQGTQVPMVIDFTHPELLVPDSSARYGFNCSGATSCDVLQENDNLEKCAYHGIVVGCEKAQTLLRFDSNESPSKELSMLKFGLFTPTNSWEENISQAGIFGLSPKSPIWKYLSEEFKLEEGQESLDVSLAYKLEDQAGNSSPSMAQISKTSALTINGRLGVNEPVLQDYSRQSTKSTWVFKGLELTIPGLTDSKSYDVCLDNLQNELLLLPQDSLEKVKRALLKAICGNDFNRNMANGCLQNESDLKKAPSIEVSIHGKENRAFKMVFKGEDFIGFDSQGKILIAIGNLNDSESCARELQTENNLVGLGRLFLTKTELIIRQDNQNNFQLGFNETFYTTNFNLLYFQAILGVVFSVLTLMLILRDSCAPQKTKFEERGEGYISADASS